VREVPARVQAHAEHALVAERRPQFRPLGVGQVVDLALRQALEGRRLHPVGQDRPVRDQVGVDAGVRLDVRVRGAEQLAGVLGGHRLDGVHVLAAGIEAAADGALGVLVAEPVAHREQHRRGRVVLAGDELQRLALVVQFLGDRVGDARLDVPDHVQGGAEGGGFGVQCGHRTSLSQVKRPRRTAVVVEDEAAPRW
jgi:hypothetical protein